MIGQKRALRKSICNLPQADFWPRQHEIKQLPDFARDSGEIRFAFGHPKSKPFYAFGSRSYVSAPLEVHHYRISMQGADFVYLRSHRIGLAYGCLFRP